MKSKYISRTSSNRRLILLYAGWGMDARPFRDLYFDGYDILVLWDYRDLTFNWAPVLRNYDEICLIAWSMGVFVASLTIHEIEPRITKRIAVGGTLDPINDRRGIPTAIYHGTINALNPQSLSKFYRRMCTSATQFEAFREVRPKRPVSELIEELNAIETHTFFHTPQVEEWDLAVIGREDRIFPAANQLAAWRQVAPTLIINSGHLPDFNSLITQFIIDKSRVTQRFSKCGDSYNRAAVAQQKIATTLMHLFSTAAGLNDDYMLEGDVLEVGCGNGTLTSLYTSRIAPGCILRLWDIAAVDTSKYAPDGRFSQCDAEVAIRKFPSRSLAYIFSSSTLQWFNSPASFLRECERVLIPGGYLIISSFVQNNLSELSQTIGHGLSLPSASGWQAMIPEGFAIHACQSSTLTLNFKSPREIIEHLRDTGVNALATEGSRISMVRRLLADYPSNNEGLYPLTYKPIFIIARRLDPDALK